MILKAFKSETNFWEAIDITLFILLLDYYLRTIDVNKCLSHTIQIQNGFVIIEQDV